MMGKGSSNCTTTLVTLDGNPGAGKSTLIEELCKTDFGEGTKKVVFVQEPVNQWSKYKTNDGELSLFDKYYNEQKRYGFAFQVMVLHTRFEALEKAIRQADGGIVFTERDMVSDAEVFAKMLYDLGKIEDVEYKLYLDIYASYKQRLYSLCDLKWKRVLLKTSPDVCLARMRKRARREESTVTLDYLKSVDEAHQEMIVKQSAKEVLIVDGNIDDAVEPEARRKLMNDIVRFIDV